VRSPQLLHHTEPPTLVDTECRAESLSAYKYLLGLTNRDAPGRLEPEGEVIQVFAPTSLEGARIEALSVSHGQQIRKGDVIAVLDTYKRRQAALQEAQEQLRVAQARLEQIEAGAKSGEIRAQAQVIDR